MLVGTFCDLRGLVRPTLILRSRVFVKSREDVTLLGVEATATWHALLRPLIATRIRPLRAVLPPENVLRTSTFECKYVDHPPSYDTRAWNTPNAPATVIR